jgi:hypothetical protein
MLHWKRKEKPSEKKPPGFLKSYMTDKFSEDPTGKKMKSLSGLFTVYGSKMLIFLGVMLIFALVGEMRITGVYRTVVFVFLVIIAIAFIVGTSIIRRRMKK